MCMQDLYQASPPSQESPYLCKTALALAGLEQLIRPCMTDSRVNLMTAIDLNGALSEAREHFASERAELTRTIYDLQVEVEQLRREKAEREREQRRCRPADLFSPPTH